MFIHHRSRRGGTGQVKGEWVELGSSQTVERMALVSMAEGTLCQLLMNADWNWNGCVAIKFSI